MNAWFWPRLLAHRCGGALAPENTLAGLDAAAACGCPGVEFDVMLSADRVPVLIHDETLARTTNGQGRVAETLLADLRRLDAGTHHDARFAGESIPTLAEAAQRCRQHGLAANVEIKPAAGHEEDTGRLVALQAARLWEGAGLPPLLSSFSPIALMAAAQAAPHLPRALLLESPGADTLADCRRLGVVALHAEAGSLDKVLIHALHAAGFRVAAYTVNCPARALSLLDSGVDCLITDHPDSLLASVVA